MTTPTPEIDVDTTSYKQMVKDSIENNKNDKKAQKEMYIEEFDSFYKAQILSLISDTEYMHTKLTKIAKSGKIMWENFMYVDRYNGKGFFGRLRGSWRWHFETSDEFKNTCLKLLPGWSELLKNAISKDIHFQLSGNYYGSFVAIHIRIEQ